MILKLEISYALVSHKVLGDCIEWMLGGGAPDPIGVGCIAGVHGLIVIARRSSGW